MGTGSLRALDLRIDDRWPLHGPRAVELGIRSQIGIQLFDEPACVASLNLYSSRPDVFDDDTVHAAHLFAIHAAHALGRVMTTTRYHDALSARASIGQATGIVMQRYTLDDKQAFELLARLAQDTGLTLGALACSPTPLTTTPDGSATAWLVTPSAPTAPARRTRVVGGINIRRQLADARPGSR
jgi:hypothetical protein